MVLAAPLGRPPPATAPIGPRPNRCKPPLLQPGRSCNGPRKTAPADASLHVADDPDRSPMPLQMPPTTDRPTPDPQESTPQAARSNNTKPAAQRTPITGGCSRAQPTAPLPTSHATTRPCASRARHPTRNQYVLERRNRMRKGSHLSKTETLPTHERPNTKTWEARTPAKKSGKARAAGAQHWGEVLRPPPATPTLASAPLAALEPTWSHDAAVRVRLHVDDDAATADATAPLMSDRRCSRPRVCRPESESSEGDDPLGLHTGT